VAGQDEIAKLPRWEQAPMHGHRPATVTSVPAAMTDRRPLVVLWPAATATS